MEKKLDWNMYRVVDRKTGKVYPTIYDFIEQEQFCGKRNCDDCRIYQKFGLIQCSTVFDKINENMEEAAELLDLELIPFFQAKESNERNQVKLDKDKPRPSLTTPEIMYSIMRVREQAVNGKYPDPEGWKQVKPQRYWDALLRHVLAAWENPWKRDEESGLLHLDHIATNVSFLLLQYEHTEKKEQ